MTIDAHHHVWDPVVRAHAWLDELPSLRRAFGLADFRGAASLEGVTASVLVQVLAESGETEEFLALADASQDAALEPVVAGVVGWADLTGPDVAGEIARLRGLAGGERLVGLRHLVESEADPGWLDQAAVRRGLRAVGAAGLVYDLLIRPAQLPAALRVTAALDEVSFVLDHAAKPQIGDGALEPWATMITELAARPNVACKVSGLVTEAPAGARADEFAPYVDVLVSAFGPDRLMFGSDWPVCLLAAPYGDVIGLARTLLARHLSAADQETVFTTTASRIYGLSSAASGL